MHPRLLQRPRLRDRHDPVIAIMDDQA
jgi:hypothetical protein